MVSAPRISSPLEKIPSAVTIVEMDDLRLGKPLLTLHDALVRAPGVQVSNRLNFAQDLRISIRGFGARSAFGIRGIQVYVDGLPYTLPDGQSQIDAIDPEAIQQIEVLRGPIAALYGNSSGGVINIVTYNGPKEPFVKARSVVGEFGLLKTSLKGGGQKDRANYFFNLSRMEMNGFRDHNEAESWKMNGKIRYDLDENSDLTLLVNAVHSPDLRDPGGLTLQQAEDEPRQAASLSRTFNTGEEVSQEHVGLVYRRVITLNQNLEVFGFYGLRDLENAIPFRYIKLDREVFGGGMKYDLTIQTKSISQQLFAGVDFQRQMDDRSNFDNLEGAPGNVLLLDQEERVTSIGFYLQDDIRLTEKWSLIAGGRYDSVQFKIDDNFLDDGNDTGSRTFDQLTGRFGLSYLLRPRVQLYANVAQSFETPTATELVNRPEGGGGFNPDIQPQKAINYEIGMKGNAGGRLTCNLALFLIQLEDELIPFRDMTDRVFYRNAGESRRRGAELGFGLEVFKGLEIKLAYTYLDAEFETFEKDGESLDGNETPGLPNHQLFGEIFYTHPSGFTAAIDLLYTASSFVDDENTLENKAYTVVNLRAGTSKSLGPWLLSPFVGIENLFDEGYNSNVRINARGGRYFEPAPGINVYGGMGIAYQW